MCTAELRNCFPLYFLLLSFLSTFLVVPGTKMSKKPEDVPHALHKLIMVGSGGVGKSALTLRFMYDEVSKMNFKNSRKIAKSYFVVHRCLRAHQSRFLQEDSNTGW